MERRDFMRAAGVALAGAGAAVAPSGAEAGTDSHGRPVAKAYLLAPGPNQADGGEWRRVRRRDLKPGDRFLMLGADDARVWKLRVLVVGPRGFFVQPNSVESVDVADELDVLGEWARAEKREVHMAEKPGAQAPQSPEPQQPQQSPAPQAPPAAPPSPPPPPAPGQPQQPPGGAEGE